MFGTIKKGAQPQAEQGLPLVATVKLRKEFLRLDTVEERIRMVRRFFSLV